MGNYNKFLTKGLEASLKTTKIENGKLRYTTDTGKCFLDIDDKRIQITDINIDYTEAQIKTLTTGIVNKIYVASDTGAVYIYIGSKFVKIGPLALASSTANSGYVLWFSGTTDKDPKYSANLKYNPYTNILKTTNIEVTKAVIGNMTITSTKDTNGNITVDFKLA